MRRSEKDSRLLSELKSATTGSKFQTQALRLGAFAGFLAEVGGHEFPVEEFAVGAFGGATDEEHVPEGDDDGGDSEQCAPDPVEEILWAVKLRGEDG